MAEEMDDNGFYREDFSAESDWEIFNSQLCELFQKWELANTDWGRLFQQNELFECSWKVEKEIFHVKDNEVSVSYYRAELKSPEKIKSNNAKTSVAPMHEDLLSLANTFGPPVMDEKAKDVHWLARFYGLRRFVVLNPRSDQNSFITKRSEFSFYCSSISVAAAEVCSSVPVFVQIYDHKWNFFLGTGITSFMSTIFDLVALEQPPQDYCYLSGLMTMFKEKLPKHCKQPTLVSVRNTYSLDTMKIRVPMYVPFGMTPLVDEDRSILSLSYFTALPHGFFPDSHTKMYAIFTWPELTDNMVIDSAMQTQFVPSKAPCGAIHLVVHATSYLSSCVKYFHDLISAKNSLESYVGRNFAGTSLSDAANPIEQLTKPHLGKFHAYRQMKAIDDAGQTAAPKKLTGPMNEHELNQMLHYLFPDLHPEVALFPYETAYLNKDPHRIKSAVADSLVHRLSCLLATCHAHFGGKNGLAQLWATFTRELRFLWELCVTIPGVAPGFPDTRTCLLHQKLQMLNVCIERRLQRQQGIKPNTLSSEDTGESEDRDKDEEEREDDYDTEEEFYDCNEDDVNRSSSPVKGDVAVKPEGRLKRWRNLKLLDSEEYLYVPITQEPVPKTEDQLQDDADVMLKLGSGSDYVTAMMCSTLQSDTEAFKAANLNAKFEDFIRWYSPNDWEEYSDDEGVKHHRLSARMRADGNTWQMVWGQAEPVPISRQKRLFDDTNEAYKILNYLETRNIGEIYGLTVVPLLHSTILKLKNIFNNSHVLELFSENLDEILADLSRFSRDVEIVAGSPTSSSSSSMTAETNYVLQLPNPQAITKKIEQLEMQFYQYICFERMPEIAEMPLSMIQEKFKEILKKQGSCNITPKHLEEGKASKHGAGSVEQRLLASFSSDMQEKLISKDYVMRMGEGLIKAPEGEIKENAKPIMPHFLRAIVTGEKLRLCGAFTENVTFLE